MAEQNRLIKIVFHRSRFTDVLNLYDEIGLDHHAYRQARSADASEWVEMIQQQSGGYVL